MSITIDLSSIAPVLAGVVRNFAGWISNSLKDGQISSYEWGQLLATTIEVALIGYSSMLVGLDPISSAGAGILGSMAISTIKKVGK